MLYRWAKTFSWCRYLLSFTIHCFCTPVENRCRVVSCWSSPIVHTRVHFLQCDWLKISLDFLYVTMHEVGRFSLLNTGIVCLREKIVSRHSIANNSHYMWYHSGMEWNLQDKHIGYDLWCLILSRLLTSLCKSPSKQVARVRVRNYIKFKTGQNLLPVLKKVTGQLCLDISDCC